MKYYNDNGYNCTQYKEDESFVKNLEGHSLRFYCQKFFNECVLKKLEEENILQNFHFEKFDEDYLLSLAEDFIKFEILPAHYKQILVKDAMIKIEEVALERAYELVNM